MKRFFRLLAIVTGIVAIVASCEKDPKATGEQESISFAIRAGAPETRTAITDNGDGSYSPSWSAGDEIGVCFTAVDTTYFFTNADAGVTGLFEPNQPITGISGDQTLYAFYPSSAFNAFNNEKRIRVNVKDSQTPNALGTFDKTADILVARPYAGNITTITNDGGIIDLSFARVLSVAKVTPADATTGGDLAGEYVKSVKIEYDGASGDAPLTGRVRLNLETGELDDWTIKFYSVSASYGDDVFALNGSNASYLLLNPTTIAAGKTVTFTVKTNKHDASKSFTLGADLVFPAGNIATIGLSIDDTWTIEDNTLDPNIIFKTPFTADISLNTTYVQATHGDLGVVGTSKSSITYTFEGTNQLRNNSNKISTDDASFYWCTSSTGLTIGGINVGTNQYFTLSFDRKVPSNTATLAITISNDGTHFFPITSTATVELEGTTASNNSYNFSIPAGEYTNLKIRFENSGNGASIDNVTLTKLAAAGASNTEVSFDVVAVDPTLEVTPSPVNLLEGNTQQLTVTGTNGALTYESNDTGVATVSNTGLITAVAEGTTTIDITSAATEDYNAGATSVTVNVSASLSFETVVITESWSADLKNATGNNAKFVDDGQSIWTADATYGHKAANNATTASFYSPKFDMSGVGAGTITFAHTGNVTGDSYQSLGKAYYTLDDGSSWTQITLTNPTSNWSWQTASISSAVYAGETIQFRWDFQGNASKTWEVKDFVITVPAHSITVNGNASPLTVELNGDATKSTTLTVASGYAWSVKSTTGLTTAYTYTKDSDTQITVTPAADNTTGSKKTGIGTMVLTDGTVDFTITFDQANKSSGGGGVDVTGPWATWGSSSAFTVTNNTVASKVSSDYCGTNATLSAYNSFDTQQTVTPGNSGSFYLAYFNAAAGSYWQIDLPVENDIPVGTTINLSYYHSVNSKGITSWTVNCNGNSLGAVTINTNGSPASTSDMTHVEKSYTTTSKITAGSTITFTIVAGSGTAKNNRITQIEVTAE